MAPKKIKAIITNIILIVFVQSLAAQYSILGYTPVVSGYYYGAYTISGGALINSDYWVVTGGTINGTSNTTINYSGSPNIGITWNAGISSGKVSYYKSGNNTAVASYAVCIANNTNDQTGNLNNQFAPNYYPFATLGVPFTITLLGSDASVCSNLIVYSWQQSTDGVNYIRIANSKDLTTTQYFTQTTYYRRSVQIPSLSNVVSYTTPVTVNVAGAPQAGSIIPASVTIANGNNPGTFSSTPASGGTMCGGNYSYTWQTSNDNATWTNAGTNTTFNPGNVLSLNSVNPSPVYIRQLAYCGPVAGISQVAIINFYQPLKGGQINPWTSSVIAGTTPGTLSGTPAFNGNINAGYSYQWQYSTDNINFTNVAPAGNALTFDVPVTNSKVYYRRMVTNSSQVAYSNTAVVNIASASSLTSLNYIKSRIVSAPNIKNVSDALALSATTDVKQTVNYFDGLGRLNQSIAVMGSYPTTSSSSPAAKDFVALAQYDPVGREAEKYLPYVAATSDGSYITTALKDGIAFNSSLFPNETNFFTRTIYEASPLGRVNSVIAPGSNWNDVEGKRGRKVFYTANTVNDVVWKWVVNNSGAYGVFGDCVAKAMYPAGSLFKQISVDENDKQVIEFKDKDGNIILKKVQLTGVSDNGSGTAYNGWLNTLYIYDNFNNLRCVVQPEGVKALLAANNRMTATILAEQCFRYEYDTRNRMVQKQIPGSKPVYMVYDVLDRLVMTQDDNLRNPVSGSPKWLVTYYENVLNRPVQTGLVDNGATLAAQISSAYSSNNYIASGTYDKLTQTNYDDYSALPAGLTKTINSTWSSSFSTATNVAPYPLPVAAISSQAITTKGLITSSSIKVLDNITPATYLSSVQIYDERGRVIQVQSQNYNGRVDFSTTQYCFDGRPLITVMEQNKGTLNGQAGAVAQTTDILTKLTYDNVNRVSKTEKQVRNSLTNGNAWSALVTTSAMKYNALGQMVLKELGNKRGSGSYTVVPLETQNFDYNIQGWLLGMNRAYVWSNSLNQSQNPDSYDVSTGEAFTGSTGMPNYFGYDLGYDKPTSSAAVTLPNTNAIFASPQYNGNIAGVAWKGVNDGRLRKYNFTYDAVNRLKDANFTQYVNGGFVNTFADFSSSVSGYDDNGNITGLLQKGIKYTNGVMSVITVDNLTYKYTDGTNKLTQVADASTTNGATSTLGDFHYAPGVSTKSTSDVDYTYDANGNLKADVNKRITGIIYNYLNLPQTITVSGEGAIAYIYDASGNKLQKVVTGNTPGGKTITAYLNGLVYVNDALQFIPHEEGRITIKSNSAMYVFDYFLKDHLGNTRMVITDDYTTSNAMLEVTHYYPFGLTMAGISSKSAGMVENKIKFQEQEFASKEFSDGSGLEMYEFKWRMHDPQTGRFWQIDPLAEKYVYNSTYAFSENKVTGHRELEGLEAFNVNDNDNGTKTVTLHRVDAPFSVQYNGRQLDAFPQQNMNDFHRNNLVVQGNSDATGGVANVKQVNGDGQVVNTFYDNTPGTKDANLDQASFVFPGQTPLNMQSVPTLGTESNGTLLQSSNVENKNISNSNTGGIPIGGDGTAVLNYSSMGSDPKTFNVTNTTSAGTVLWQASFTGTSGTGSPAVLSLQPGTMLNITVTQPGSNTNTNYNYNVRQLDVTKPVNKTLPVN